MKTRIYGASDDLVEIDGEFSEEIDCYSKAEKGLSIHCSDGTIGKIKYDGDWRINLIQEGLLFDKLIRSNDENPHEDEDAHDCTSYSDVLIMKEGLEWIEIKICRRGKRYVQYLYSIH